MCVTGANIYTKWTAPPQVPAPATTAPEIKGSHSGTKTDTETSKKSQEKSGKQSRKRYNFR